jgi:hypothetical protein
MDKWFDRIVDAVITFCVATLVVAACHSEAYAATPMVVLGGSIHSEPENGTWWDAAYPYHFAPRSYDFGVGVRGDNWSLVYEDSGHQSVYCLVQGIHYYSEQHPRGVWAAWEPSAGPVFAQIGLGAYRPQFTVYIPDNPVVGHPFSVTNNRATVGYMLGVGTHLNRHVDLVANGRYAAANGNNTNDNWLGLGKFVAMVGVRAAW